MLLISLYNASNLYLIFEFLIEILLIGTTWMVINSSAGVKFIDYNFSNSGDLLKNLEVILKWYYCYN